MLVEREKLELVPGRQCVSAIQRSLGAFFLNYILRSHLMTFAVHSCIHDGLI